MPAMALGTTTIENIVAHDAAALEKDLASIRSDTPLTLPGVPQIVSRVQQMARNARATMQGLRELRRPEDVAKLRGKSPEEVSTVGMLRAYRERNMKKPETTEVA